MEIETFDETFVVTTYAELDRWRDLFLKDGGYKFMVVLGAGGVGKSTAFEGPVQKLGGVYFGPQRLSALHVYMRLYDNRDSLVLIDDVDELWSDRAKVNILKAICDTKSPRTVSYGTRTSALNVPSEWDGQPYEHEFVSTNRVAIITNDLGNVGKNMRALLDRAFVIDFKPSNEEVHGWADAWCQDREVFDFIGANLWRVTTPSGRYYAKAADMRRVGGDWKGYLERVWRKDPKVALVADILHDPTLDSKAKRVAAFAERGGGSSASYMRWQAEYFRRQGKVPPGPGSSARRKAGKSEPAAPRPPQGAAAADTLTPAEAVGN